MAGELAIYAFKHKNKKKQGNTTSNGESLYLHGNKIAEWTDNNQIIICDGGGWKTNVTKNRLNKLGAGISQRNFVWYRKGQEWNGDWQQL